MTTFGSSGTTLPHTHASVAICYTLGFEKQCVRIFRPPPREQISKESRRRVNLTTNALLAKLNLRVVSQVRF